MFFLLDFILSCMYKVFAFCASHEIQFTSSRCNSHFNIELHLCPSLVVKVLQIWAD